MKVDAEVYIGKEKGIPYIHIYRKDKGAFESMRFRLHTPHDVSRIRRPEISASTSSADVWRDWAAEFEGSKQNDTHLLDSKEVE